MSGKMILILGGEDDDHAIHMQRFLAGLGHPCYLVDSRWFPTAMTVTFDPAGGWGELRLPGGEPLVMSHVHSVYWRSYPGVGGADLPDPQQAWIAENDSRSLFESLLIGLPARWVNGWQGFQLHQTKPVQLARVARLGAAVPPTLLGNDPAAIRQFVSEHGDCIVKPVQGGDHTARLTLADFTPDKLDNLRYAPITVQAEVPGTNVRVFVAGDQVLACEIRTGALDFRDDDNPELLVHALPADVAAMSRRIARELSLLWTGIDFRLTEAGKYVFLEANPSPMFLGFEEATGLPLTQSLAGLLIAD